MNSSYIHQSKLRCKELGMVETLIPVSTKFLNEKKFHNKLLDYKEIIEVADYFLQKLLHSMKGTPILYGIHDQDAYLLYHDGDLTIKQTVEQLGMKEGICFTENNAGTNVIDMSIRHRQPFQLIGKDHFHHFLHTAACYAVPFYSIEENILLGSVGIFTTTEHANPFFLSLLTTVVDSIERELLLRKQNVQLNTLNDELNMLNQILLDTNHQYVMITDHKGLILDMNSAAHLLLNGKKRVEDSILDVPIIGDYFFQVMDSLTEVNGVETSIFIEEELHHFILDIKPIFSPETNKLVRIVANLRDISDIKKTDELLRNTEKLAVVGQLASGVAHEIRNPLTTVKGFMQLIRDKFEKQSQYELIISELDRINLILGEFLVLGRPQSTLFKDVDCSVLLEDIFKIIESQALMNDIILHIDSKECGIINGDSNQIKQVFINILKNAMEAMPYGGKLSIELDVLIGNQIIRFKDEGVGIDESIFSKLGQPFATTKTHGNGLGIMVSKKIVESHKGKISFKSESGKGTTVEISFPLKDFL